VQINEPCKLEKATDQGTGCPKNQEDKYFSYQTIQNTLIEQQILKKKKKKNIEIRNLLQDNEETKRNLSNPITGLNTATI
jgi:hypothetical protein